MNSKALVTLAPLPRSGAGGHEVKAEVNLRPRARAKVAWQADNAPKPMNDLTRDMMKQLVKTKRPKASPIWTTSRGREVPVADMSDDHVRRAHEIVRKMPSLREYAGRAAHEWTNIFQEERNKRKIT